MNRSPLGMIASARADPPINLRYHRLTVLTPPAEYAPAIDPANGSQILSGIEHSPAGTGTTLSSLSLESSLWTTLPATLRMTTRRGF